MRVTFLVSTYTPAVGGAQIHTRRIAEGLVARHGHEVDVITTDALQAPSGRDPGRIPVRSDVIGGVSVRRYPVARRAHAALRRLRRMRYRIVGRGSRSGLLAAGPMGVRFAAAAWRAGRRSDVVVAVGLPLLTITEADLATRGRGAAFVVMPLLHLSAATTAPEYQRILKLLAPIRRADGCTSSTAFERDWFASQGVDPERIMILPPGCDPERYLDIDPPEARRRLGLPERATVGYVGRMAVHKGVDTLADAMVEVWRDHPDVTLLLAGNRTGWAGFDDMITEVSALAGGRLVVREGFDDDDKALLLAACDVVAFPSQEESFGMVTVEAWCARRAVVAGDIDAVRSLVRPGEDGDLVPVKDPAALAAALTALLEDPDRRIRYGRYGRARAEVEFTWDGIVDRWDDLLRSSVARRRSRDAGALTAGG